MRYTLDRKKELPLLKNPALIIVSSFAILILVGALLLTLPFMNRTGSFTPFLDALFTATSATCVTGLIVYDTYVYFNMAGQTVIIALIQLGGLGLVTLTSFFYLLIGKRMNLRTAHLTQESVSSDDKIDTVRLVKMVVFLTASIEAVGALLLMCYFVPAYGTYGIFMSVFFSVHYLVIYYLLQPYDIHMQAKSHTYSIVCAVTYFVCYMFIRIQAPTLYFAAGVIIFTVLYITFSLYLAYRFAPKTFKLK